jgi:6,7-dimethyl-8-ribityllumazine synthase
MSSNFRAANSVQGEVSGEGMRIGVVCGRFNDLITNRLLDGVSNGFGLHGVKESDVTVVWVPGAFEIPIAAQTMAQSGRFDAVITLGAVIRGDTPHFDYVAGECARGVQDAQLASGVPIVFGVLTTENLDQALVRSDDQDNKGEESARTAIEMVDLLRKLRAP